MNWVQFKDPLYHLCLPDAEVESWFLTQGIAGLNTAIPFLKFFFVTAFTKINENI